MIWSLTLSYHVCMSDFYCSTVSRDSLNQPAKPCTTTPWGLLVSSNTLLVWAAARHSNKTQQECLGDMEHADYLQDFPVADTSEKSVVHAKYYLGNCTYQYTKIATNMQNTARAQFPCHAPVHCWWCNGMQLWWNSLVLLWDHSSAFLLR